MSNAESPDFTDRRTVVELLLTAQRRARGGTVALLPQSGKKLLGAAVESFCRRLERRNFYPRYTLEVVSADLAIDLLDGVFQSHGFFTEDVPFIVEGR